MIEFISNGGPIMWPLLLLSIISFGILLERIFFLISFSLKESAATRDKLVQLLRKSELDKAFQLCAQSNDPLLNVIFQSEKNTMGSFQATFRDGASKLLRKIRKGTHFLDTAITMAPLLGLLGTVLGLIEAFSAIGTQTLASPAVVTGGIGEALLATAFGLAIAIGCLLPFNASISKEESVRQELEELGSLIEGLLPN